MSCANSDILALIDYFENGTDLSSRNWDNYNYYDLWNAVENGASPPSRPVCGTFSQADVLSVTLAVLGTLTTSSDYLGENVDFYYLYLKAIGSPNPSPTFTNFCVGALYDVFEVGSNQYILDNYGTNILTAFAPIQRNSTVSPEWTIRRNGDNSDGTFLKDSNEELSFNSETSGGTSLSTFIAGGSGNGFITTLKDISGNGNTWQITTAANQPRIINSSAFYTLGSKPTLCVPDGETNRYISTTGTIDNESNWCVIMVCNFVGFEDSNPRYGSSLKTGVNIQFGHNNTNKYFVRQGNITYSTDDAQTGFSGSNYVLVFGATSGTVYCRRNGVNLPISENGEPPTANTALADGTYLFAGYNNTSSPPPRAFRSYGSISESYIFNGAKSTSDIIEIENELISYYGIS